MRGPSAGIACQLHGSSVSTDCSCLHSWAAINLCSPLNRLLLLPGRIQWLFLRSLDEWKELSATCQYQYSMGCLVLVFITWAPPFLISSEKSTCYLALDLHQVPCLVAESLTEHVVTETLIVSYLKSWSVMNYFLCYLAVEITSFTLPGTYVFHLDYALTGSQTGKL